MIPANEEITEEFVSDYEIIQEPSLTYKMKNEKIIGKCDNLASIKQAIYKILNTERYENPIYGWDYGIELKDLIGKDIEYVMSEIEDRITDALLHDDRITDVKDFDITTEKRALIVRFTVVTTEGNILEELIKNV